MADRKPTEQTTVTTDAGMGTGFRFSPHVLVFGLTFVAIFYAAQGAVLGFIHAWWGDSFQQVEFVMDEWRPNDGYPYIAGHITGWTQDSPFHVAGAVVGDKRVAQAVPSLAFEKGARLPVWWSNDAPFFSYNGELTNAIPVAAMPTRPGWGQFLLYGLLTLVVAVGGFIGTVWVAARFSRGGGTLTTGRR
ncbi:MAG: hypothetical protein ABI585_03080 [Betaproteobacteria bacterium]